MAIDVQKRIAQKRGLQNEETMMEHHVKNKPFLTEDVELVAGWMSTAVLSLLSDLLNEEKSSHADLKSGLQRSFRRLLKMIEGRSERVIFLHEAIPGFTALSVRKEGWESSYNQESVSKAKEKSSSKSPAKSPAEEAPISAIEKERALAVKSIVSAYIQRTGNRVISIEGSDLTLVLFPVEDLKENLLEMGFWEP